MIRRNVLVGLAALATGPALAQSSPPPAIDAPAAPAPSVTPAEPAPAPAMKIAPPAGSAVSPALTEHMTRTLAVGSLSLATSRIALAKAKNPTVRQFAEFETAEQETIADILKSKMMPDLKPSGDVKAPTDADVAGNLDPKGRALVEKMTGLKAGAGFDRDYVKAQIDGHKDLLAIQETYLKAADDPGEINLAKLARGMIKEHLTLLGDLQKKVG
jgi:putative membrane protein